MLVNRYSQIHMTKYQCPICSKRACDSEKPLLLAKLTSSNVPLDVRCGKYYGGVFVVGDYSFDRAYMYDEELALLVKVKELVKDQMTKQEIALLSQIIKTYTKAA